MDKRGCSGQPDFYVTIGKEIDDRYMEELKKQSIHPEIIKEMAKDIKIVYTPLTWNRKSSGAPCVKRTWI